MAHEDTATRRLSAIHDKRVHALDENGGSFLAHRKCIDRDTPLNWSRTWRTSEGLSTTGTFVGILAQGGCSTMPMS